MIICFEGRNWRPDEKTLINTGYYWIPRDMSEELAGRALKEGVAVLIEDDQFDSDQDETGDEAPKRRGRPRKGPAPENKAL